MKLRKLIEQLQEIERQQNGEIIAEIGVNHEDDGFCTKALELIDAESIPATVMLYGGQIELAPGVTVPASVHIVREIREERFRQLVTEGVTDEQDDTYENGELSRAAAAYALHDIVWSHIPTQLWPWVDPAPFKPADRRRNLVKAGALIVAEIERLDRLSPQPEQG